MSNQKANQNENGRRHFSPDDKIKILRLHLLEKVPISEVCQKHQITPTQFYQWQKIFFDHGATAFAKASPRASSQAEQKLADKLRHKDEVIAEIMAEFIVLKKELGES